MLPRALRIVVIGEAYDGETALAQVRAFHPDLVLMDIHWPEMDGYAATRHMKALPAAPHSMLLNFSDDPTYTELVARQTGTDSLVRKQDVADHLLPLIDTVCANHS